MTVRGGVAEPATGAVSSRRSGKPRAVRQIKASAEGLKRRSSEEPSPRQEELVDYGRTPFQRRRYQLILSATLGLLREVGFDKAKIQQVSARSGVALATIYRYFGSRDCLIYEASYQWGMQMLWSLEEDLAGENLEERALAMVHRPLEEFAKEPNLTEAWARSNLSNDKEVVRRMRVRRAETRIVVEALLAAASEELVRDLFLIIEQMTAVGWSRWALKQQAYEEIAQNTERAVRLVLAAHGVAPLPRGSRMEDAVPERLMLSE